jgi:hypothetical protein
VPDCSLIFQGTHARSFVQTRLSKGTSPSSRPGAVPHGTASLVDRLRLDVADCRTDIAARKHLAAQLRNSIKPEKCAERNGSSVFLWLWEVPMTFQVTESACAFAWRNYLLLHSGISETDNRRSALYRYVTDLRDTGECDFNHLQIAAVAYLKKLDELHDDRAARLAADQALAGCLEQRSAQPDT